MMGKAVCVLALALIVNSSGFKISPSCVEMCKSAASLHCANQCEVNDESFGEKYGRYAVYKCLRTCRCSEEDAAFPDYEECESLQNLAINQANCRCVRPKNLKIQTRSGTTPANPWENWCKHQCSQGLGGSACYCDIIP